MSTYVLVHGAWHGGWCWDKVVSLLRQAGHIAVAPDMPGHGADRTPISEITLDGYVRRVCETIEAQTEPVILVGHSMGGALITQAAEECPDKVRMLVYLCAFLPANGQSLADLARQDTESLIAPNRVFSEDLSCSTIRAEALQKVFYADCSNEDVLRAKSLVRPQASSPSRAPVRTSEARFGRVPRVYIETLQDRAISPALQRRMYMAVPCQKVITLDSDHSPFFSCPEALVAHLNSL